MPSKGKKPSRPPPATASPSSRTPPPLSARGPDAAAAADDDDAHLRQFLSDASTRFPSLISNSALWVRVSESDASPSKGNNAALWLSEAAMLSSSIPTGSLVSVSLPAVGQKPKPYIGFLPLNILAEGCDLDEGIMVDKAGCYFAIATVFPSRKVVKDGVRLSWGLSCTMGFPDMGRVMFVSLISGTESQSLTQNVIVCNCEDLYLDMVLPKDGECSGGKSFSCYDAKAESVGVQIGNGTVASPRTPLQSKLSSPGASPVQSRKCQEGVSSRNASLFWDVSSAMLALEEEKVKDLLQIFAARWLYGRHLLAGNLVTVPICGQQCVFRVKGAGNQSLTYEDGDELWISRCKSLDEVTSALLVDTKTRIHLCDLKSSIMDSPRKADLSVRDSTPADVGIKEVADIPRVGGLSKEYAALKEIIMFSLEKKKDLPSYKGVLLYGPPGTGKTSLASSCALDAGARLYTINGPEIVSQYYGESEQALDKVFETAKGAAPAVIFIDELDAIAPARKDGGESLSRRMVGTLLKLMDEKIVDGVLLIAATNRPDTIDPALRRPGRLDREIEIGVPSPDQRLDIMRTLLVGMDHSLSDQEIHSLAFATHGFVGADLAALCNEAALAALHRHINLKTSGKSNKGPSLEFDGSLTDMHANVQEDGDSPCGDNTVSLLSSLSKLTLSLKPFPSVNIYGEQEGMSNSHYEVHRPDEVESKMLLTVTAEDFRNAKMKVRPSAMREVLLELPNVRWEDVGGQAKVKKQLIEAVLWPQTCPDAFERIGIQPPRGLLMIGPPGCSKTLMARAVASEAKVNFLAVKGPELFSKWVGESEKAVKSLFAKARANSPAIIFFDEIDGLAVTRGQENDGTSVADRVLNQMLVEMEGLNQRLDVTVIAATNRPDKIDPALLRPGRFDRILDVQPPDEADREDIFQIHMRGIPCSSDVSVKDLARITEAYTGADIKLICREAALAALEENLDIPEVSMAHFKIGIGRVQPSDIQFYKKLAAQFRRVVDI